MPISTIGSYEPTMDEFDTHWGSVNLERGGTPATDLVLEGNYKRLDFQAHRTTLSTRNTAILAPENARQIAASGRDIRKAPLKLRLGQFRSLVNALLSKTVYPNAMPKQPQFNAVESRFLKPFDDMANLWGTIDADTTISGFTPPLLLAEAYARAGCVTDLASLRTFYKDTNDADQLLGNARKLRDALLPVIYGRLKQYRQAVLGSFPANHALILSLPALTPPPGSTPDAVTATITWNPATNMAVITWSASTNAHVAHYSVRYCPGTKYRKSDEIIVSNVAAGTLTLSTDVGLAAPGALALFRVYVVLDSLNERGSKTLILTRPEPVSP